MAESTGGAQRPAKKAAAKRAPAKKATAKRTPAKKVAAAKAPATRAATAKAAAPLVEPATPASGPAPPTPPARTALAPAPGRAASGRPRSTAVALIGLVLVVLAFTTVLRLGDQERNGPAHEDLSIKPGIPATIFLPEAFDDGHELPDPHAVGERPPVIVMAHGYSADRASMSGLARSLAKAGYAVLSIDLRGHGANTHPFQGDLNEDIDAAVTFAETSPFFDGDRIAVLGHSMGAGAALDFATEDDRPLAVIPVSGGWVANDAVVPKHTLLIAAEGDPGRIRDRQTELADELEARDGDVTRRVVDGTNHITILRDSETVRDIVAFLDPVMGVSHEGKLPGIDDPRFKTAGLYLVWMLGLLALLGSLVGRLAPVDEGDDGRNQPAGSVAGFVLVGGSLLLTLPLLSVQPIDPLPLGAGQPIAISFALASGILWGLRVAAQRGQLGDRLTRWVGDRPWMPSRSSLALGIGAGVAIFVLLLPLAGVLHRLVPTPTRLIYWILVSALVLPFFAAFEALIRRGGGVGGAVRGLLGRALLMVVLAIGVNGEVLPRVLTLVVPILIGQYVIAEVFAAGVYARARNTAVIAVADAVIVGMLVATMTPVG
jgi:dienelactone hydrolase